MIERSSRQTTLVLLEKLVPNLIRRTRTLSSVNRPTITSFPRLQDGPLIDSSIREKIMAQTQSRRALPSLTKSKYNVALAEIGMAINRRDPMSALRFWEELEDIRKSLHDADVCRLPDSIIKDFHNLFVSFATHPHQNTWITTSAARSFAVYAAKHHLEEALCMLMLHYIKSNDSQTTLQLYNDYCPTLVTNDITCSAATQQDDASLALLLDEEGYELEQHNQGRALVVIAAITAHAMKDSFKAAFELLNDSGVPIRLFHRRKFLRHLQGHVPLLKKVASYLDRLSLAFVVARPALLSRSVMNMSHPHNANTLKAFYDKIWRGINGKSCYLAAQPSGLSNSRVVAMTESGWTSFQTAFIRCERIDAAAKVWDDLAAEGIKPGVTMWTGLLDTYADLRNSKQAMATWNMMLQQDILPDSLSYRAIISVLFDDNNSAAALDRFAEYKKLLDKNNGTALVVYNTVLRGLLRVNRDEEAKDLLKEMKSQGPKPDIFSFNTFLGYFARQKDFQGLGDVLAQMSTANIQGDVVTFSTILTALLAVGRKDAPTTIMNLMRKQGIKPNAATYTAVIDGQMREQSHANLNAALALLEKMEKGEGIKPNEITYTAILSGLYRSRWLSREEADPIREKLVAKMRNEGIMFRLPTYHILIRAALESEDEMSYLDALKFIQEMKKNGIPRVGNTWYILLSGLMKRELWQVAYETVGTMLGSGHEPNDKLKSMVHEIHRQHQIQSNTSL